MDGGAFGPVGEAVVVAGGHPVGAGGDVHLFEGSLGDAAMGEVVDDFGVELGGAGLRRAGVLLLGGLSLALGVVAVPGLLLHPRLLLLVGGDGGVAVPAAVVAAVGAGGEVAGEAFVGLVLAAVVALGAMHFDVAGGAAGEAGEVDAFGLPVDSHGLVES